MTHVVPMDQMSLLLVDTSGNSGNEAKAAVIAMVFLLGILLV